MYHLLLLLCLIVSVENAIYNQDGLGYTGVSSFRAITDPITMTAYTNWPAGFVQGSWAFIGGVYDGTYVWIIPCYADRVIRITPSTGAMTGYNNWPAAYTPVGSAFWGGVYDGTYIWMVPNLAAHVVRIDTRDGSMTAYNSWPAGLVGMGTFSAFRGGVYDGTYVWMVPN
eukprot:PhF_6_TR30864/c0_g1_i3/m.45417